MTEKAQLQLAAPKNGSKTSPGTVLLQRKCACGGSGGSDDSCDDCKKKQVQRKPAGAGGGLTTPPIVHDVLRSPGQPLDGATRSFFEPRFEHDFSKVRVHADETAAQSARAVNAFAYTAGQNIVFERGEYNPGTPAGKKLLAHELAHIVQQARGSVGGDGILPAESHAEKEAEAASERVTGAARIPIQHGMKPSQIGRAAKTGADAAGSGASPTKDPGPTGGPPVAKTQRLRFDILGADTALADFLAKAAGISRDPDLRVTSLEDLITTLESKAPASSPACVEHISIFNHAMPGYQAVTGEGEKKTSETAGAPPGKLRRSGFTLDWLYQPANQAKVARLRNVFCCGSNMYWLGCGSAGVTAEGGTRSEKEKKESEHRFGKEFGNRYRDEKDALAHGAHLEGAKFGKITVQSWADATCTTIRAATDFVTWDVKNPDKLYTVGYGGEFLDIRPSGAGECACDHATGRVTGKWEPGKGIEYGDAKWHADLDAFNKIVKSADPSKISPALLALVADVAPSVAVPAGVPLGPKPEPWVMTALGLNWDAYTYQHLCLCFPTDAWKWIGINPNIIQTTPAYTRTTLSHELLHAADMVAAAKKFQADKGPPPAAPPDACRPGYQPKNDTDFGKYVLAFHDFYEGGLTPARHMDVYAASATPNFQRFTPAEKLSWFSAMLTTVPADVSAKDPLSSEALVNGVFQNPVAYEEDMREKFANQLFSTAREFVYGKGKDLGKARTLVNHFNAVWKVHPMDRALLISSIDMEKKK